MVNSVDDKKGNRRLPILTKPNKALDFGPKGSYCLTVRSPNKLYRYHAKLAFGYEPTMLLLDYTTYLLRECANDGVKRVIVL